MRKRPDARKVLLWTLASFVGLQMSLAGLFAWGVPWLRNPNYGYKATRLRERTRAPEQPRTVVMLGSSRTAYGLNGSEAEAILSREQGCPVTVYNFGLHSAGPVTHLLNLRRLLADGIRPDLLLVEVLPALLSRKGSFNDLRESQLPTAMLRREELELLRDYVGEVREIREADWWMSWALPGYYHRFALVSHVVPTLLPLHDRLDGSRDTDPSGWAPVHANLRSPASRQGALAFAHKDYSERLAQFELGGPNVRALGEILEVCETSGIPVALVLMPEGPAFRSWYPSAVLSQVQGFLRDLSGRYEAPVIDASTWMTEEGHFLDSHHLLPDGAIAFSRRLAQEALLPLQRELVRREGKKGERIVSATPRAPRR